MSFNSLLLKDLLILTKDGEWGKGEPATDKVEMLVIRGADFHAARYCNLSEVPVRYIPEKIAQRKFLRANDILIETAGGTKGRPTGRTVFLKSRIFQITKRPITCASFSRFLRVNSEIAVPEYVFWYLQFLYEAGQMEQHQVQHTGVARFQYTKFAQSIKIPLPPLPEQKAIARILGTLDDKIELNQKMNQTLEAMARAIFKSWFVDFDPVRAKMEGRQPAGMDAATAALFPDSFQDSPLGLIPKGWEVKPLSEITQKIGSGATPRGGKKVYVEEGVALIRSQNVYDHHFQWNGLVRITDEDAEKLRGVIVEVDDILLNITGDSILRTCVVQPSVLPARVNQHVAIIRPIQWLPCRYLHLYLAQSSMKQILLGFDTGATRKAITKGQLESVEIPIPSQPILSCFKEITDSFFARTNANSAESRTFSTLRNTLLPKLMSGEIRVAEAEEKIETIL